MDNKPKVNCNNVPDLANKMIKHTNAIINPDNNKDIKDKTPCTEYLYSTVYISLSLCPRDLLKKLKKTKKRDKKDKRPKKAKKHKNTKKTKKNKKQKKRYKRFKT